MLDSKAAPISGIGVSATALLLFYYTMRARRLSIQGAVVAGSKKVPAADCGRGKAFYLYIL